MFAALASQITYDSDEDDSSSTSTVPTSQATVRPAAARPQTSTRPARVQPASARPAASRVPARVQPASARPRTRPATQMKPRYRDAVIPKSPPPVVKTQELPFDVQYPALGKAPTKATATWGDGKVVEKLVAVKDVPDPALIKREAAARRMEYLKEQRMANRRAGFADTEEDEVAAIFEAKVRKPEAEAETVPDGRVPTPPPASPTYEDNVDATPEVMWKPWGSSAVAVGADSWDDINW